MVHSCIKTQQKLAAFNLAITVPFRHPDSNVVQLITSLGFTRPSRGSTLPAMGLGRASASTWLRKHPQQTKNKGLESDPRLPGWDDYTPKIPQNFTLETIFPLVQMMNFLEVSYVSLCPFFWGTLDIFLEFLGKTGKPQYPPTWRIIPPLRIVLWDPFQMANVKLACNWGSS